VPLWAQRVGISRNNIYVHTKSELKNNGDMSDERGWNTRL